MAFVVCFVFQKTHSNDPELIKNNAVFNLATRLIQIAKNSNMDDDSLKIYVKSLRRTYLTEVTKSA